MPFLKFRNFTFMKKTLLFIAILFISNYALKAQTGDILVDSVAEKIAYYFSEEMLINKFDQVLKNSNKQPITIEVEKIYNNNGQVTVLSQKLSATIAHFLSKELNASPFRRTSFIVQSPYDFTNTSQKINNSANFDYALNGTYLLSDNAIVLSQCKLTKIDNAMPFEIAFDENKIPVFDIQKLKYLDKVDNKTSVFQQFIEFNRNNVYLSDAGLLQNSQKMPLVDFGNQKAYLADFDVEYNMFINIKQSAHIYAFFYDPDDIENPYLWYIENTDDAFQPNDYINFYDAPFAFTRTNNPNSLTYIKIIATKDKLDINKYLTRKTIIGYESVVVESSNCQKLLTLLYSNISIQTYDLVLSFKN